MAGNVVIILGKKQTVENILKNRGKGKIVSLKELGIKEYVSNASWYSGRGIVVKNWAGYNRDNKLVKYEGWIYYCGCSLEDIKNILT